MIQLNDVRFNELNEMNREQIKDWCEKENPLFKEHKESDTIFIGAMYDLMTKLVKFNSVLGDVSNNDVESMTAEKIWFDIKHSTIVSTEKHGDCFTAESVVRAINKFTN